MLADVLAGMTQASIITFGGYPFDTTKVRMQSGLFKTTWGCVSYTFEKKGIYGFYKGGTMPFISHLMKRPIQYPTMEYMKKKINKNDYKANYLIGIIQGPIGTIIGNPLQVIKIKSQTNTLSTNQNIINIWNDYGFKGFYRGFIPTLIKDTLFGMSFIGTYYTLRDIYGCDKWYQNFINGSFSHCLTWFFLIPIDYIKTNVQKSRKSITVKQVINIGLRKHGVRGFWKGVVPACARTIPVSGLAMIGYESIRQYINGKLI
jgi:hypothetical protein